MAGDRNPSEPDPQGAGAGWTALSYLVGGMVVWGFAGWLVDRWLHTGGIAIAVGCVVGLAGSVFLIARRLGA